jgi:hypothetical protein
MTSNAVLGLCSVAEECIRKWVRRFGIGWFDHSRTTRATEAKDHDSPPTLISELIRLNKCRFGLTNHMSCRFISFPAGQRGSQGSTVAHHRAALQQFGGALAAPSPVSATDRCRKWTSGRQGGPVFHRRHQCEPVRSSTRAGPVPWPGFNRAGCGFRYLGPHLAHNT